jgi:hypothetical protein
MLCSYSVLIENLEEFLKSDICEPSFQYMTNADVSMLRLLLNKEVKK